jgi:hypothetical protein
MALEEEVCVVGLEVHSHKPVQHLASTIKLIGEHVENRVPEVRSGEIIGLHLTSDVRFTRILVLVKELVFGEIELGVDEAEVLFGVEEKTKVV